MDHQGDPSTRKQLSIPGDYITKGNSKAISFSVGGVKIKQVIDSLDQLPEQTTFFVNGKRLSIFSSYDSSIETTQSGGMNIVSDKNVEAYMYTLGKQKYLMVTAYAEKSCGSFSRIEYYYFLPLSVGSVMGITFMNEPIMPDFETDSTEVTPKE